MQVQSTVVTRHGGAKYSILEQILQNAERKDLVWQGKGSGTVTENMNKKEERINKFVREILAIYPPGSKASRVREEESYPPYN